MRDRWGFRGCKKRQRRQCKAQQVRVRVVLDGASQAQEKVAQGKEVKGVVQGMCKVQKDSSGYRMQEVQGRVV